MRYLFRVTCGLVGISTAIIGDAVGLGFLSTVIVCATGCMVFGILYAGVKHRLE